MIIRNKNNNWYLSMERIQIERISCYHFYFCTENNSWYEKVWRELMHQMYVLILFENILFYCIGTGNSKKYDDNDCKNVQYMVSD